MKAFSINGTTYRAVPFNFNLIVDLEERGVSLSDAQKKPMSLIRAYLAICAGKSEKWAGEELESHIVNGGKFDDVLGVMSKEMEESDFFRNLNKSADEEVAEDAEVKATTKSKKSK